MESREQVNDIDLFVEELEGKSDIDEDDGGWWLQEEEMEEAHLKREFKKAMR